MKRRTASAMRHSFICFALLIAATMSNHALAASFDCSKATTGVELTICTVEERSLLDERLAKTYQEAISTSRDAADLKARQRQWLKSVRDPCPDVACLKAAYVIRIEEVRLPLVPGNDACGGQAKNTLDLAYALDGEIAESARSTKYGQTNDGSLNYGGYWLRPDISLLYARLHCWKISEEVIAKIEPRELQEESRARLSIEYAKAGYFAAARSLLDSLQTEEASTISAYGIAEALVAAGRVEDAKAVVLRVTTRWNHLESPAYLLIGALVRAGRLEEAGRTVEEIDHTWNEYLVLAGAYMRSGKKSLAETYIQKAIGMAHDPRAVAHIRGWAADVYIDGAEFAKADRAIAGIPEPLTRLQIYLRLAEALDRAKQTAKSEAAYSKALATVNRIKGDDRSDQAGSACSYIAKSYARTGRVNKVESTVDTVCPDKIWRSVALSGAINELAKRGDVHGARHLQTMLEWKSDADGPIAAALARKGAYEEAATVTREIGNEFVRSDTVRRVAALTPSPRVVAVWLEDTKTFKNDDDRAASVQALAAALARSKNTHDAIAWLEQQPRGLVKARGYLGVTQGLLGIVPGMGSPND